MATAAAVAFVVYSCGGNLKQEDAKDIRNMPVQTADDLVSVQTENGQIQNRMEAPRILGRSRFSTRSGGVNSESIQNKLPAPIERKQKRTSGDRK